MTTANETRREVMSLAWSKFRYELSMGRSITFAAALVHAWAWVKGAAARAAAADAWAAAPIKRTLQLRDLSGFSPIARANAGRRFGGRATFKAAYTTAALGC